MIRPLSTSITALCSAVLALSLGACDKPQIRVYTVAKATPQPAAAPLAEPGSPAARPPRPTVTFAKPPGWEETPGNSLSLANFRVDSPDGPATVNITPLAGMDGRESAIVNMWREQIGQPALAEEEAKKSLQPVEIGGEKGQLFEISGNRDGQSLRIVTAFVHRADGSWFYKLQGNDAVVAAQRPTFIEFLKTVKIQEGPATAAAAAPMPAPVAPAPTAEPPPSPMVAPAGWQTLAPGQMQVAKFGVSTPEGKKAEVSVSVFPSDTGGTLANVNRWRRQLGLGDVDEAGLADLITPLGDASIEGAPGAILADLTNGDRRMLGAIVPREGRYWFYKMMGDAAAVNAQRDNFVHFAKNQP